jgi:hypothetical protein
VLAIIMSKHRRKLMKKGVTLLSALLFFAVMTSAAGIASDAVKIKKVKSLIASFKDSIKETSFSSDWQSSKAAWQNEFNSASDIQKLRSLVYKLELNLEYNSQVPDWRSFLRNEWVVKIRSTEKIKEFVTLLVQLEQSLKWEAHKNNWKQLRISWLKNAKTLSESTAIAFKKYEDQDLNELSEIRTLSKLVLELEKKVKYDAQQRDWRRDRKVWVQSLNTISNLDELKKQIKLFFSNFKSEYFANSWINTSKSKWISKLTVAGNVKAVAQLLAELERALKWSAHYPTWWNNREGWITKVNRISGQNRVLVKLDTSSPGEGKRLTAVTGFLFAIEGTINQNNYFPSWNIKRNAWIRSLFKTVNIGDVGKLTLELKNAIKPAAFSKKWKKTYKAWEISLKSVKSLKKLVSLVLDFEKAILWSSQDSVWKKNRALWYKQINKLTGITVVLAPKLEENTAVASSSTQTAPTLNAASKKIMEKIKELVVELERDLVYNSKSTYWRVAWIKEVLSATTVKKLGEMVYKLESKIPYRNQVNTWRSKRRIWMGVIRNVRDFKTLALKTIEVERSFLWNAHTNFWIKRRSAWVKRFTFVTNDRIVRSKYSNSASIRTSQVSYAVRRGIDAFLDFESELSSRAFNGLWKNARIGWIKKVASAINNDELRDALLSLEKFLKPASLTVKWKKNRIEWIKALKASSSINVINSSIQKLEQNIKWAYHSPGWEVTRFYWYPKVGYNLRLSTLPEKEIIIGTEAKRAVNRSIEILLDLERGINKNSFSYSWRNQRARWISQLFNSKSVKYLASHLILLETKIRDTNFSKKWKALKASWIINVSSATTFGRLVTLASTLERAILQASQQVSWKILRNKWYIDAYRITRKRLVKTKL